jgi:hypothetical protein
MFLISGDQSQWVHLYRVQRVYPIMFVIFCCGEAEVEGVPAQVVDLRIISKEQAMTGNSWWVRKENSSGKMTTRADITKFLELHARFQVASATKRCIDDVEMIESSNDELALAISIDEELRVNLESIMPTLFSKMARNLIKDLNINKTGIEFGELSDWTTRNQEA